ncbi:oxalate transporter [Fistulina hepatica ATCC 64428]|nr:oxalate transporter [Fistulina hepatica ATCC 64428]
MVPRPLTLEAYTLPYESPSHPNSSLYTLDTIHDNAETPLLAPDTASYGVAQISPAPATRLRQRRILLNAALKFAAIFVISTLFLGITLWLALPTLEEQDREALRIPKSFEQLQQLNFLLKKYRDIYPYRVVICYVTVYLFLQAFSLPGSMYLSILGGAVWGVARALPLACCCVATGATLCYLSSAALGPALLTLPTWKARLDKWAVTIRNNKQNVISFLIVLRIAPLPPHWVVNIVCPHVGIGIIPFWVSTALGILGVTVIHTTIGGGLDDMTSAADFHLISWKNGLLLGGVVAGVMIPVGLRYWFRREVDGVRQVAETATPEEGEWTARSEGLLTAEAGMLGVGMGFTGRGRADKRADVTNEEDFYDTDDDEDIILEAGPSIHFLKKDSDDQADESDSRASSSSR